MQSHRLAQKPNAKISRTLSKQSRDPAHPSRFRVTGSSLKAHARWVDCQRRQLISRLEKEGAIDPHHVVVALESIAVGTMVSPILDAGRLRLSDTHERRVLDDDRRNGRIQRFDVLKNSSISNLQSALLIELFEARNPDRSDHGL